VEAFCPIFYGFPTAAIWKSGVERPKIGLFRN